MLKKISIAIVVLVVVVIGALLIIPLFVSVDQFRPQIQQAVEKNIRGKVTLGKLSLSLFPMVKVTVDGAQIVPPAPFDKEPLANIKSIEVKAPLLALLTSPSATIAIVDADIKLVNQGPEKSNLTETLPVVDPNAPAAAPVGETLNQLPAFVRSRVERARFAFVLENAHVAMKDTTGVKTDKTEMNALNVKLEDIGLNVPMKLEVSGLTDVVMGTISVNGKLRAGGSITFKPVNKDNNVDLDMRADLSGLDIAMQPLFHKPAGTAFETLAQGTVVQNPETITADMKQLALVFGQLKAGGTVKAKVVSANASASTVDAKFAVKDFNIQSFGAMIPLVRDYKLNGQTDVTIAANGSLADPALDIKVILKAISGATPQLAKPLTGLNGTISVTGSAKNPTVLVNPFDMKIGVSDMAVRFESHGLKAINLDLAVKSNLLNADELLGLQPLKIQPGQPAPGGSTPPEAVATQPLDESLNQLAPTVEESLKNPMLDTLHAKVSVDMKKIVALGAEFEDAALNLTYANRKANISKSGIKGYGGLVYLALALDLDPKALGFDMDAGLKNVQVARAINAHMPGWKDAMAGTLNGELKVSGRGLRREQIAANLRGGLKGQVVSGKLNFPIIQLVSGALDSLPKIMGKKLEVPAGQQSGQKQTRFTGDFKTCELDTSIEGRKINLKNLDVVFNTSQSTQLGDVRFKADGSVNFDRQVDLLGTAFLSPDIVRVGELKGPSGQIEIPLKVKGDMSDPKPDYAYTAKILGERALKNLAGRATDELKNKAKAEAETRGKAAAQKAIDDALKNGALKNAPAPVQQGAEALKKKLKGFKF